MTSYEEQKQILADLAKATIEQIKQAPDCIDIGGKLYVKLPLPDHDESYETGSAIPQIRFGDVLVRPALGVAPSSGHEHGYDMYVKGFNDAEKGQPFGSSHSLAKPHKNPQREGHGFPFFSIDQQLEYHKFQSDLMAMEQIIQKYKTNGSAYDSIEIDSAIYKPWVQTNVRGLCSADNINPIVAYLVKEVSELKAQVEALKNK